MTPGYGASIGSLAEHRNAGLLTHEFALFDTILESWTREAAMAEIPVHLWKLEHGPLEEAWGLYLMALGSGEDLAAVPGPGWSLLVLVRGAGSLTMPGRRKLHLEAGEVALVETGSGQFGADADRGCRVHHLHFSGEVAARWMAPGLLGPLPRVIRTGFDESLLALFARLLEMARDPQPEGGRLMAGILAHLLARLEFAARQGSGATAPRRLVQEARRILSDPDRDGIGAERLAEELGVSYSWFRRCFRGQTGLAPQRFRARQRLERACGLLVDTSMTIRAIAARLDFTSQAYFARWFRKSTGLSPSVWRAQLPKR